MAQPRIPRATWILIAAAFLVAIGFGLVSPVLPQLATSFGVGITAESIIVSSFALFRLLFAPASGWFVKVAGERTMYIAGLLVSGVATGLMGYLDNLWLVLLVLLASAIGGAGSGAVNPPPQAGRWHDCGPGPGWFAGRPVGLRMAFTVTGLIVILTALAWIQRWPSAPS